MQFWVLAAGDIVALTLVTLIGFGSHGELSGGFLARMAAVLVPLCSGWFLLAPWLGLFDRSRPARAHDLWRPAFVMLFAGPMAAVLRGIVLGVPVLPLFALVLSATSTLGLVLWRAVYLLLSRDRTLERAG
jgi:hypothetical protein